MKRFLNQTNRKSNNNICRLIEKKDLLFNSRDQQRSVVLTREKVIGIDKRKHVEQILRGFIKGNYGRKDFGRTGVTNEEGVDCGIRRKVTADPRSSKQIQCSIPRQVSLGKHG